MTTAVYDRAPSNDFILEMVEAWIDHDIQAGAQTLATDYVITAAKEMADNYLNNPFEDSDGIELDIPNTVVSWIVIFVSKWFVKRLSDIKKDKAGEVTMEYFERNRPFLDVEDIVFLDQYRLDPGPFVTAPTTINE